MTCALELPAGQAIPILPSPLKTEKYAPAYRHNSYLTCSICLCVVCGAFLGALGWFA